MLDFIQSKEHRDLALEAATQSMVLLKNDPSNGLPITSLYKKACVSLVLSTITNHLIMLIWTNSRLLDPLLIQSPSYLETMLQI